MLRKQNKLNLDKRYITIKGNEILTLNADKLVPLVNNILYEEDVLLLVAKEKAGKSIFSMQLTCNMTTGTPFLGAFDILRPLKVWYFATEGKLEQIKQRFISMSKGVDLNPDNILLISSPCMQFNTERGWNDLIKICEDNPTMWPPNVIIIDPVYTAIKGGLQDEKSVIAFLTSVRTFAQQAGAAVILVTHKRKQGFNDKGDMIDGGDDEVFGSTFWKANADHIMRMNKTVSEKFIIRCETQRSGDIVKKIEMRLIEPEPLHFELADKAKCNTEHVYKILKNSRDGVWINDLCKRVSLSRPIVYSAIKDLKKSGIKIDNYTENRRSIFKLEKI